MPLVERALLVLERREVQPQLGLLKSTMLQLDATFSEKAYGSGSFSDFVEKLKANGYVNLSGSEGRYFIERKTAPKPEQAAARPEEALPRLRDVLETHRLDMEAGCLADQLGEWVEQEHPGFQVSAYGFQEFAELLNFAQDKLLVRVEPDEEKGLLVYLGAEFYPPAARRSRNPRPRPRRKWRSRSLSSEDSLRRLPNPSLSPSRRAPPPAAASPVNARRPPAPSTSLAAGARPSGAGRRNPGSSISPAC